MELTFEEEKKHLNFSQMLKLKKNCADFVIYMDKKKEFW